MIQEDHEERVQPEKSRMLRLKYYYTYRPWISILPPLSLAFVLLAWNDVTLIVLFDCVFLSDTRVREKGERGTKFLFT